MVAAIVCLGCLAYTSRVLRVLSDDGTTMWIWSIHGAGVGGAQDEQISRVLLLR